MESIIKNAKPSATQEFQRVLQIKKFFWWAILQNRGYNLKEVRGLYNILLRYGLEVKEFKNLKE